MQWASGLFECTAPPGGSALCCASAFCPCVVFGQIIDETRPAPWALAHVCLTLLPLASAAAALPFAGSLSVGSLGAAPVGVLAAYASNVVRHENGIEGSVVDDAVKGVFCACCTLAQARNQQLRAHSAAAVKKDDTQTTPPSDAGMTGMVGSMRL